MIFMAQATLTIEGSKEHVQALIEQLWAAEIFVKRDSDNTITVAGSKQKVGNAKAAIEAFHDGTDIENVALIAKGDQPRPLDAEFDSDDEEAEDSSSSS